MDTAWIQVFVLTLAECVAPPGKAVCQESEFDLQFLTRSDCEFALHQLISLKDQSEYVIVNKSKSSCAPSARQRDAFASLDEVNAATKDKQGWRDPVDGESPPSPTQISHQARLADLPTCEESDGKAPCKMGGIIIEAATQDETADVWRRDP